MSTTYYDMASRHMMKLIEIRPDGKGLYHDLDDDTRVICRLEAVDLYPRPAIEGVAA